MAGSVQSRFWACIGYPESLNDNWIDALHDTMVPCAVSPLHDKDLEKDGVTYKKSHYHILVDFGSQRRKGTAQHLFDMLGIMPSCINILHPAAYFKYLWHDEKTDKTLYDKDDVQLFSGFVPPKIKEPYQSVSYIKDIINIINEFHIVSYRHLISKLLENGELDLIEFSISKSYAINSLFKKGDYKNEKSKKCNDDDDFIYVPADIRFSSDFPFPNDIESS